MTSQQLWLYLYSTKNIVGSVLGILGILLFFAGIINSFWFLIVIGLYAIGVLVAPANAHFDLSLRQQLSVDELRAELDQLVRTVQKKLPSELFAKVESIRQSILSILPFIADVNAADHDTFVIRKTALEYLPETLQNYLNLPPAFANLHPVRNGKTARQLLGEQLDLLDQQMKEVVVDYAKNDTQKLLAHGRFLQSKFQTGDLLASA